MVDDHRSMLVWPGQVGLVEFQSEIPGGLQQWNEGVSQKRRCVRATIKVEVWALHSTSDE